MLWSLKQVRITVRGSVDPLCSWFSTQWMNGNHLSVSPKAAKFDFERQSISIVTQNVNRARFPHVQNAFRNSMLTLKLIFATSVARDHGIAVRNQFQINDFTNVTVVELESIKIECNAQLLPRLTGQICVRICCWHPGHKDSYKSVTSILVCVVSAMYLWHAVSTPGHIFDASSIWSHLEIKLIYDKSRRKVPMTLP